VIGERQRRRMRRKTVSLRPRRFVVKPSLLLRFASGIALVQFAAHTLLFAFSSPKHGPEESAVVEAMKAHRFDFAGSLRSYWDFYFGYGLEAAFCLPHRGRTSDTRSWPGSIFS